MGLDALTRAPDGTLAIPETEEDWLGWVSPTSTRSYTLNEPLLDWLSLYGEGHGFKRDDELEGYDPRTDFRTFIMQKGVDFEDAVVKHLETLTQVHTVPTRPERSRDLMAAQETFAAMQRGQSIICQAVLRDAVGRNYGAADLLVRSDELHRLFPSTISLEDASVPAQDLGDDPWHYRVVDIKFTTLHFLAGGSLQETHGSTWAYMVQVYLYNRILGRLQGYLPPASYLLGRGWQQKVSGQTDRGTNCLDRLGIVPQDYVSRTKGLLANAVDAGCAWVRRVRTEGGAWNVLPVPSLPELMPNMGSTSDQPWHYAKQKIGVELEDLTMLWHVALKGRDIAMKEGIQRWSDPECTASMVGVTGPKRATTLDAILEVNRDVNGLSVRPDVVHAAESEWRATPILEFYVDFETVSDLDDDFTRIPEKGGQPLIFMIGCGHIENGEWQWACFTADSLKETSEAEIIDGWFAHMATVKQRMDSDGDDPNVFHWSHAELSSLETAFTSAKKRHPEKDWGNPKWFDFLVRVMREEPVVVRGAMSFGLKAVAKAMHALGCIETDWEAGPTDGLGAMVGAWSCALEAEERGCTLAETTLMQDIAVYNEVDCKVIMEIVNYLRMNR